MIPSKYLLEAKQSADAALSMLFTHDEESISALCTPRGSGALALIRLVGGDVIERCAPMVMLKSSSKLHEVASHTIHYASFIHPVTKQSIDEGMVIVMRGPRTFTGQDTLELTLHNNQCIIEMILEAARSLGVRAALAGEFSKRAYLNNKIDVLQAEAINELINATNMATVSASLAQLKGSLSAHMAELESDLLAILALSEASFEFLDEEQRDLDFEAQVRERIIAIQTKIQTLQKQYAGQQRLRDGIKIALIGSVNAGKSTLFNALLGKDRAIVSEIAGTTRDTIEGSVVVDGSFRTYVDTAGLRKTGDVIEQQGIERSWHEAGSADVVLLVIDGSRTMTADEQDIYSNLVDAYRDKMLIVQTKSDQPHQAKFAFDVPVYSVSAAQRSGINELKKAIDELVVELLAACKSSYAINARHHDLLSQIDQLCQSAVKNSETSLQYEMVAYHIKEALERVSQLTGKNITEKFYDKVFNDFCVGK